MYLRKNAFALILVIVATAGAFAAAVHGTLILRAATIETNAVTQQTDHLNTARAAALTTLAAISPAASSTTPPNADNPTNQNADQPEEEEDIEIPAWLRDILGDAAEDLEEQADERNRERQAAAQTAARTPRRTARPLNIPTTPTLFLIDRTPVRVTLKDAGARINVNNATDDTLRRYLTALGLDQRRALETTNQILDWIDPDDFVRPLSLESEQFANLGINPRNNPVSSIHELRYLPAVNDDIFQHFLHDLDTRQTVPHLGSARAPVLRGIGFSEGDTAAIVNLRQRTTLTEELLEQTLSPAGIQLLRDTTTNASGSLDVIVELFTLLPPATNATLRDARDHIEADDTPAPRRFTGRAIIAAGSLRALTISPAFQPMPPTPEPDRP